MKAIFYLILAIASMVMTFISAAKGELNVEILGAMLTILNMLLAKWERDEE